MTDTGERDHCVRVAMEIASLKSYHGPAELADIIQRERGAAQKAVSEDYDFSVEYLTRLLLYCAPQCIPERKLSYLCTQIDSYITGLHHERDGVERAARALLDDAKHGRFHCIPLGALDAIEKALERR